MDTICAIATARAASAVGIIRVSGEKAVEICDKILVLKKGTLFDCKGANMRLCTVTDGKRAVDSALVTVFFSPMSYTGENVVEICCHGGVSILERVMKLLIKNGARYAVGGEFTKRAFLNGKLDLVQAEAVCDLINSTSALDASLALDRMSGRLSNEFTAIFDELVSINTDILAYVDFPEEGLYDVDAGSVLEKLNAVQKRLIALENSFNMGSVISDGVDTVIIGAPNVGKSTLLNAIVGFERAIVSDTAGTTRDMVTERAVMGDVTLNLCDTAGIRKDAGEIESRGIELAKRSLDSAGLVLAVFDSSRALDDGDREIIELCKNKTAIAVVNKCDLSCKIDLEFLDNSFSSVVMLCAKQNHGINELEKEISSLFLNDKISLESGKLLTNARHFERVVKAREKTDSAIQTLQNGFTPDLASVDITEAAGEIGAITGAGVSDRIIDDIFSKFCVGK